MTTWEFKLVEDILFMYPEACLQAEIRRVFLANKSINKEPGVNVQGGSGVNSIEAYAMNDDRMLQAMDRFISRIESALIKLRYEDVSFVKGYYFEGREYPESRELLRWKRRRICQKLLSSVISLMSTLQNIQAYQKEMRDIAIERR
jgi:hypothetical protein